MARGVRSARRRLLAQAQTQSHTTRRLSRRPHKGYLMPFLTFATARFNVTAASIHVRSWAVVFDSGESGSQTPPGGRTAMSDEKQGWHDLGLSDQVTRRKLLVTGGLGIAAAASATAPGAFRAARRLGTVG